MLASFAQSFTFAGWHTESFAAVTPQGLRDMARAFPSLRRTVSGERLQSLLTVLELQQMQTKRAICSQNTNLVVDLFESSGTRHSYRADGLYLCSIDNSSSRSPTNHSLDILKRYFHTQRPNQSMKPTAPARK